MQAALWPWHYHSEHASILFRWDSAPSAAQRNASAMISQLSSISDDEVAALQRGVMYAAQRIFYRGTGRLPFSYERAEEDVKEDAADILLRGLQRRFQRSSSTGQ